MIPVTERRNRVTAAIPAGIDYETHVAPLQNVVTVRANDEDNEVVYHALLGIQDIVAVYSDVIGNKVLYRIIFADPEV